LPIGFKKHEMGFWVLNGVLNTVYNRTFIISDAILLLYIIIKRKDLSKELVLFSFLIFALYMSNFVLEGVFNYYAKDSIFLFSLFVSALYYTTESQDKQTSEAYEEARKQSIEIDNQKTKFLLNMSHEIRTPLNTIMGYSDYLLMEESFTKDKIEMEGENVYQASETLLSLINNILDVSRIESGKETVIEGDYKLEDLVTNLYEKTVPRTILRNNVKFNLEIDETLPANYNGDIAKLERILISILYNAVEHTTMGEVKLKVEGQRNNNEIEMTYTIRNAGHEMKEDRFNIDFNTITSLETTENIDNNILGIIIAKQLLNIMNGTVEFINKPGQGTQYIIKLKQKCYGQDVVGNVVEKIKKSTEEEIINCEGKVVIVADDNAINLNIAKRLLVKFGFVVETCLSGQECLEKVREKKYDIIFLDHMMPGMDGVETLNHLKEEHGNIAPTIALTANASDDSRSEYMKLGFTDYLTKPIDMKELDKILKRLFQN
jgi:signal transduction histidine kinase/ActR/RegA family two-component response regulator